MADIEQKKKIVPLTGEIAFGEQVSELVFGVNIFDLDFGVQVDSFKQPIKRDSLRSGHVHDSRTSACIDQLDQLENCFIVFKHVTHGFEVKMFCVCDNVMHIRSVIIISVTVSLGVGVGVLALDFISRRVSRARTPLKYCNTSITRSQRSSKPARTNARFPKVHRIHPEVELESSRSTASPSLGTVPIENAALSYPHGFIVCEHSCEECKRSNAPSVCHKLLSISSLLVHVCLQTTFTDHRISGLPIRATFQLLKTICEHTLDNSPTFFSSSILKLGSSKRRVETLYNCSVFLFASSQYLSIHFRACPSMS